MKIIIKKTSEIKEVSFGHAVNYLIPQGLAVAATSKNLKELQVRQAKEQDKKKQAVKKVKAKLKNLTGKEISFKVKSGKKGKIYGAITKKEIAEKLGILKSEVLLDKPIKKIGEYDIKINIKARAAGIASGDARQKSNVKVVVEEKN
ncbi:50S ribosomal protein L9 [Patescibacteria group bacterium]|nr:50S ribosomal protein L9 [Patescibacteria group bacterium]MBU1931677.1 50S ribosomal protein L9 [Patescibacteria group bacterium]